MGQGLLEGRPQLAHPLLVGPSRVVVQGLAEGYAELARRAGMGIVLETPTWRASADWGGRLGYDAETIAAANRRAVALVAEVRDEVREVPVVVSGCVGPRGHGDVLEEAMSIEEAAGVALAARAAGLPVALSFTVETDGRLPSGQLLGEAVEKVDAATDACAAYYMVNCAHPTHFAGVLEEGRDWTRRLRGVRANASRRSHAELDAASDLDVGDPEELAAHYAALRRRMPWLTVLGGCCGTDGRHIRAIARACRPARAGA